MTNDDWPVEVTPDVAAERMREHGALYVDVRTEIEFARGHPAGALNIPIFFVDQQTGAPRPNPEFMAVLRTHLETDAEIYCGCRSGARSLQATMMMRQAGFERVANVECGFHGKTDSIGRQVSPGWLERGLPVAEGDGGPCAWKVLRAPASDDTVT